MSSGCPASEQSAQPAGRLAGQPDSQLLLAGQQASQAGRIPKYLIVFLQTHHDFFHNIIANLILFVRIQRRIFCSFRDYAEASQAAWQPGSQSANQPPSPSANEQIG